MVALAGLNSRWEAFAQLLTLLVVFIFVLALTYFATRWAGNMQKTKMAGRNIQILETMRVSNTKYIQIIKIGSKCFAVAVCKDTITYLSEINEQELTYSSESKTINTDGFKAILEKFKKDKPIITRLGGTVCVPSAALVKCNTITILENDVSIIRIEGASEITVSTRSICKTLAISLPSLVEIPILIRLFPDAVVSSAAITLYVINEMAAKKAPAPTDIPANAFLCFLIHCNITLSFLPN